MADRRAVVLCLKRSTARIGRAVRRLDRLSGVPQTLQRLQVRSEMSGVRSLAIELWRLANDALDQPDDREAGLPRTLTIEQLVDVLAGSINPIGARRNYTYTPPYSIERTLRAYFAWLERDGADVTVLDAPAVSADRD